MAKVARSNAPSQSATTDTVTEQPKSLSMLAQEEFGEQFHGNVETPKPPVETPPEPAPDEPPIPEGDQEEDVGGGEENVQVEGEEKAEAPSQEPTAETDEKPISTVRELVDYLEADPTWFDDLKVDVTVDDQPSQVPLKDVIESFRKNQAADNRLERAKSKLSEAQQEIAQRNSAIEEQYNIAAKLVEMQEQQLSAEYASINWDELHRTDPALWSAERVRLGERNSQIQQTKQQVAGQFQHAVQQQWQQSEAKKNVIMQEQTQLLMEAMPKVSPDWGDQQKAPAAKGRLFTYLVGQGFEPKEIEETLDHKAFIVAEKARLWDESQSKVQITKKRIQSVPKVLKPGARKDASTVNLEKVRQARQRLGQSHSIDDALAVLRAEQKRR